MNLKGIAAAVPLLMPKQNRIPTHPPFYSPNLDKRFC